MKRLFVIGAQRSGTSALVDMLGSLPSVSAHVAKEPNYMLFHRREESYSRLNGPQPMRTYNSSLAGYEAGFQNKFEAEIKLDGSTNYLSSPSACNAIAELYPNAFIYAQLRHPVERALSLYEYNRNRGHETRVNFLKVIQEELMGKWDHLIPSLRYVHSGMYWRNIQPYLEVFESHQLRIARFQDFVDDPKKCVENVCAFCEISIAGIEQMEISNKNARRSVNFGGRVVGRLARSQNPVLLSGKRAARTIGLDITMSKVNAISEGFFPSISNAQSQSEGHDEARELLNKCFETDWSRMNDFISKNT